MLPRIVASAAPLVVLACALVAHLVATGFVGISDDDASRTLIAWSTRHAFVLDPTRSSWLPVPTWYLGPLVALTRDPWWTPRLPGALALVTAAVLAHALARRLGASVPAALFAVALALLDPWSRACAWGPAVPEMPAVALLLGALVVLARERPSPRESLAAGLLLGLACGHRYEAWAATAGITACVLCSVSVPARSRIAFMLAVIVFPIAWLAINARRNGDPFDFVQRVFAYRRSHEALDLVPVATRVWRFPRLVVTQLGGVVALACIALRRAPRLAWPSVAGAVGVLVFLVVTEARGGGATHHVDRTLLPLAWLLAPVAALAVRRGSALARVAVVVAIVESAAHVAGVPHDIDPETIRAGNNLAERVSHGCVTLSSQRLDALWLTLATHDPDAVRTDRVFASPDPSLDVTLARSRADGCTMLVVDDAMRASAAVREGFVLRAQYGAWRVLDQRSSDARSASQSSK